MWSAVSVKPSPLDKQEFAVPSRGKLCIKYGSGQPRAWGWGGPTLPLLQHSGAKENVRVVCEGLRCSELTCSSSIHALWALVTALAI